jgi:ribosomal protein S27AE
VATSAELADERQRWLRATAPEPIEGNLVKMLKTFADWRTCDTCGDRVLYANENLRTDTRFTCGRCQERRKRLGKSLRRPSLPVRVLLHVRSLFLAANDNAQEATVQDAS